MREWRCVASSDHVAAHLRDQLSFWGAPDPGTVAVKVLASIEDELLPVLRLKWFLIHAWKNDRGAQQLLEELAKWRLSPTVFPALAHWYGVFLLQLAALDPVPIVKVEENVITLLTVLEPCSALAHHMVDCYAAYVEKVMAAKFKEKSLSRDWLADAIARVEQVARTGPACLSLLEQLSALNLLLGVMHANEVGSRPAGMHCLATAVHFDPYNRPAWENIETLIEMAKKVQSQIPTDVNPFQFTPIGMTLIEDFSRLDQIFEEFAASERAREIKELRIQAITRELPRRLGLDPASPVDQELAEQLTKFICLQHTHQDFSNCARELAREKVSNSERLPWDAIEVALAKTNVTDGELLTLLLSSPEVSVAQYITPVLDGMSHKDPVAANVLQIPARRALIGLWLFSLRDIGWKSLAVAGLGLISFAGYWGVVQQLERTGRNQLYASVLDAVRDGNDSAVIARAEEFERHASSSVHDARRPQILAFRQEATVRQAIHLQSSGKSAESQELLNRVGLLSQP